MTDDDVIRAKLEGVDVSFTKTLDQGIKKVDEFHKSIKWMEVAAKFEIFESISHGAEKLIGIAEKLHHTFDETLAKLDHVAKRANLLNISPKFLNTLQYGARTAGVSGAIIEKALVGINMQL